MYIAVVIRVYVQVFYHGLFDDWTVRVVFDGVFGVRFFAHDAVLWCVALALPTTESGPSVP